MLIRTGFDILLRKPGVYADEVRGRRGGASG